MWIACANDLEHSDLLIAQFNIFLDKLGSGFIKRKQNSKWPFCYYIVPQVKTNRNTLLVDQVMRKCSKVNTPQEIDVPTDN